MRGSISTFDPFLLGAKVEIRMRKSITAHARLKRGAYQPRNTKIHSLAQDGVFYGKGIYHYTENRSIPLTRAHSPLVEYVPDR